MVPQISYPEDWAILGPGSRACLQKIFGSNISGIEGQALAYLADTQDLHFARLGIPPARRPRLRTAAYSKLSLVDFEHALCECEKYSRAVHPDIRGARTQVSRRAWEPGTEPLTWDLPAKWQLAGARRRVRNGPPAVDEGTLDPSWEVSHVVRDCSARGKALYLVRWVGYGPTDDSWHSAEDLASAPAVLREWCSRKARIARKVDALRRNRYSHSLSSATSRSR